MIRATFFPILIFFELLAIFYKFSNISVHNFLNMLVTTVCLKRKIHHQCKSILNFRKFSLISPSPSKLTVTDRFKVLQLRNSKTAKFTGTHEASFEREDELWQKVFYQLGADRWYLRAFFNSEILTFSFEVIIFPKIKVLVMKIVYFVLFY